MRRALLKMIIFAWGGLLTATAQSLAVKSNLFYDATTTLNVGAELSMGEKTTGELSFNLNPWTFSNNKKWKHWMLQPGVRFWQCQKFNGAFWGIYAQGGEFNWARLNLPFGIAHNLKDHRYEGWYAGAGLEYGYQWMLSKHWNIEAAIGIGYDYINYEKFNCEKCGEKLKDGDTHYVGPSKATLSLLYLF